MRARRLQKKSVATIVLAMFIAFVYFNNTSFLADPLGSGPILVAHRALGQDYSRDGLTGTTCTAAQMLTSGHSYLENTIPSMEAAFAFGADIVEFDVHPTTDGHFAVFHDWTVDCRTNGSGVTRDHTLDSLQALDVGYGYTADGGQTYPFRGRGVGMMPSLAEVLATFPDRQFLINVKSQDLAEGERLADRLAALSPDRQEQLMVYGGGQPVGVVRERLPHIQTIWPRRLRQCLYRYAALGWAGYVPADCARSVLMVPINYAPWLWGWPNRFLERMDAVGSRVFVIGDYSGEGFSQGLDDPNRLSALPLDFSGGIWTDRIDRIGPAVARRQSSANQ